DYFLFDIAINPEERPPGKRGTFPDAGKLHKTILQKMIRKLEDFTEEEVEVPTYYKLAKHEKNGAHRVAGC
ncbi:hypothetical protein, partial [Erwinia amylovora]